MATVEALDEKIQQVNQRLKAGKLGFQIERRGSKLALRGTLPPRPDSVRVRSHQQRLSLGLPATPTGLKQAEQEAKIIAGQLLQKSFDWTNYAPFEGGKRLCQMNLSEQLKAFEEHFWSQAHRTTNPASTKTTWNTAYAPYLRKLESIAARHTQLTIAEAIYKTIESTPINSRSRQVCCTALDAVAKFLKVELTTELKTMWGDYGNHKTKRRQLPSDADIEALWESIPNPNWRFVYGVMAAFGLRNHEVFFCDFSNLAKGDTMIEVLPTTKTGSHQVWAFHPEWIDRFGLRDGTLPQIETDLTKTTLLKVGQRVTAQFKRYDIPFPPYDLRHAWAVRTIHVGLSDTVAAKMMGHSVAVHSRTYHQWITERDQRAAVEAALKRRDSI